MWCTLTGNILYIDCEWKATFLNTIAASFRSISIWRRDSRSYIHIVRETCDVVRAGTPSSDIRVRNIGDECCLGQVRDVWRQPQYHIASESDWWQVPWPIDDCIRILQWGTVSFQRDKGNPNTDPSWTIGAMRFIDSWFCVHHQHHVGSHYGDLTRSLAPMINLSCEKFDSAHRIIVKRNLSTTQSRFYQQLVVERVRLSSLTMSFHPMIFLTILAGNASRSHAATSDTCPTFQKESGFFWKPSPSVLRHLDKMRCCTVLSAFIYKWEAAYSDTYNCDVCSV